MGLSLPGRRERRGVTPLGGGDPHRCGKGKKSKKTERNYLLEGSQTDATDNGYKGGPGQAKRRPFSRKELPG